MIGRGVLRAAALLLAATLQAEVMRLDFGATNSPVWPGFTAVTAASPWLAGSGRLVGFWRTTPDDLAGDGVVAVKGGYRLRLPIAPGDYRVWVLSGDSVNGGQAEIQHLLHRVVIRAEGQQVLERQRDYWYAEGFDYDPRADVWERYAGTNRFLEATFDVRVKGDSLTLEFEGRGAAHREYAFPLNAVMVFPQSEAATMAVELQAIRAERRRQWSAHFPQVALPEPDRAWVVDDGIRSRGYTAWWRDYQDRVYPNTVPRPDETAEPPHPFATPGESEPVTLCVRPVVDLTRVTVSVGDLRGPAGVIASRQVQPYLVRYNERVLRSGLWYAAEPWALIPWNNPDIPSNVTRQCWLKVKVPAQAAPGAYAGQITLKPAGGEALTLPFSLRVLPFPLERSTNATFFYFGSRARMEYSLAGGGWLKNPEWWRYYGIEASNLVEHGFVPVPEINVGSQGKYGADVTVRIGPDLTLAGLDWSAGRTRVTWLAEHGYLPPDRMWVVRCTYGTTFCGGKGSPTPWWNPEPGFSNLFCQITRAIDHDVRSFGWGLPVFEWAGELSNHGDRSLSSAAQAYGALRQCGVTTALRGDGWVDWSLCATNQLVDYPTLNFALLGAARTAWVTNHCRGLWLYNFDQGRYGFGFFAWAAGASRRLHEGHMNDSGTPWDKFDGDHYQWECGVEPTRAGVAPLVSFELMAEGLDDRDYLNTLARRLERAPTGPAREAALQTLDFIRSRCVTDVVVDGDPADPGRVDRAVNWRDLQTWRGMVAEAILRLTP